MGSRTLVLSNGQTLSFLDQGAAGGPVCFFFHGFPGSSRQIDVIQSPEVFQKFRVIAVDRPGFGYSTRPRGAGGLSVVQAIPELADQLGIDRFHLVAVSGGNPWAFQVGDSVRDRILSLTSICGLGPLAEPDFFKDLSPFAKRLLQLGKFSPSLGTLMLAFAHGQIKKNREMKAADLRRWFPPADVEIVMDPKIRDVFRESLAHAFHQGARGPALEMQDFQRPWKIRDWNFPFPVTFWHGLEDQIVPPDHSRMLAARIAGSKLNLLAGEGHYSLPIRRIDQIFWEGPGAT